MNEYDASAETHLRKIWKEGDGELILEKINIKPVVWNNSGEPNMDLENLLMPHFKLRIERINHASGSSIYPFETASRLRWPHFYNSNTAFR